MNFIHWRMCYAIIVACLFFSNTTLRAQNRLQGVVADLRTREPLIGATIHFPELKTAAITDEHGQFVISQLPKGKFLVEVSYTSYNKLQIEVQLSGDVTKQFLLEPNVAALHEMVVTGTSILTELKRSPSPIVTLDRKQMNQLGGANIIDVLSKLPGVTAVSTGPNISKPMIRGLGLNRVLTLYDGIRQEGQQWGDEHGVEIDEYSVQRAEVVKGPASLVYGSDALAGVVNLIPSDPVALNHTTGRLLLNYQTNNRLMATSASVAGNQNGFIWSSILTHKRATNFQNAIDGRVYGTAFQENDAAFSVGLNRKWGFSHLNFSVFDDEQGVPDGSRDSVTRKFTKQVSESDTLRAIVPDNELNSYQIPSLHQHVQHYRVYLSNHFILGSTKLSAKLGYQQSIRREYDHPEALTIPGLYLKLSTITFDLKFILPAWKDWITTTGFNGMVQNNQSNGTAFIIPNYQQADIGPFTLIKRSFSKIDLVTGIRSDFRSFHANAMYTKLDPNSGFYQQVNHSDSAGAQQQFQQVDVRFSGIAASAGIAWQATTRMTLKANVGRGYRAPNVSEITANGAHPGTNIYQLGNDHFLPEFNLQEDMGVYYQSKHVSFGVDLFHNLVSNFIYNVKVLNQQGADSVILAGNQTYQFRQNAARLYGGEVVFDLHPHPLDWLHFENSLSVVYGRNLSSNADSLKYLPTIPPINMRSELRANFKKGWKHFTQTYLRIEMNAVGAQNRYLKADHTETMTPAYTLFNASFGSDVTNKNGRVICTFAVAANNLFDMVYQSNLSRLKYMDNYLTNTTSKSGIYNMGRNVSVKLIFPFRS